MKCRANSIVLYLVMFSILSITACAQNPVNWTANQLMEPSTLAKLIESGKNVPVIISVGPGALIPHSKDIGSVKDKQNLLALNKFLDSLPKNTQVVVYCGCCPYDHCPNARPAVQALKDKQFNSFYLLNLPKNLKADWLDKGYPRVSNE